MGDPSSNGRLDYGVWLESSCNVAPLEGPGVERTVVDAGLAWLSVCVFPDSIFVYN